MILKQTIIFKQFANNNGIGRYSSILSVLNVFVYNYTSTWIEVIPIFYYKLYIDLHTMQIYDFETRSIQNPCNASVGVSNTSGPTTGMRKVPQTMGIKIQLFQNMVMLHIKLKGITNAETW